MNKSITYGLVAGILVGFVLGILFMLSYVKDRRKEIALMSGLAAGYSLEKKEVYDAVNYLMTAKYFDHENIEYHTRLGYIFYDMGVYEFAEKEFQQVLDKKDNVKNSDVNRAVMYCNIGTMHWKSDEQEKAMESFRLALGEDPGLPEDLFGVYRKGDLANTTNIVIQAYYECLSALGEAGLLPEEISEELSGK